MATAARRGPQHADVVRLILLGTPRIEQADGASVALERLLAALLAMLAINGPMPRARAAELLWPEADDKGARNNLRQRLFRLRQAAHFDVVVPDVTLVLADGVTHDLTDLGARLEQDADAARGELLGALAFDDCLELADWVAVAREQWAVTRRNALAEIAVRLEAAGQVAAALRYAERLVADDPLLEHAHRRLMRLHYLRGDRAAALTAFERCSDVLRRELKASPGKETLDLARTIESGAAPVRTATGPKPVTVLRPPRLVGREREWQAIELAWQQQRVLMLVGAPGIGKTRLASDFAAAHDGSAMFGARPGDARVPYALAARTIRGLAQRWGTPPEAWVIAELARLVPEFGTAATGRLQTLRLFQAIGAAVAAWCSAGLAALVIDDLQFGDDASLEILLWLCAQERGPVLRWLISLREGEAVPQLAEWRARVEADAVSEIALGSLDAAVVEALLDSLAIPGLDAQAWAAPMARHTGGNPMFILETLLSMLARGADAFAGTGARLPAPANIGQLIERRLDQLSPPALRLARVAALAGTDFSAELAAQVLGVHLLDIAEPWRELQAAQVIQGQSFAHDLILEATLRTVPQPIAQALHKSIAGHLQAQGAQPASVARHWLEAGVWPSAGESFDEAARLARLAGRHAEEATLLRQAELCFDRAGQLAQRFEVSLTRAVACRAVSTQSDAEAAARHAVSLAGSDLQRARALRELGVSLMNAVQWGPAAEALHQAQAAASSAGAHDEQMHASYLQALAEAHTHGMTRAVAAFEKLLHWAVEQPSDDLRHAFFADFGVILDQGDRRPEAVTYLQRAVDYFDRSGQRPDACESRMLLARTHLFLGQTPVAIELLERAVRDREELSAGAGGAAIEALNLGRAYLECGRYTEAVRWLDAVRARMSGSGGAVVRAAAESALARAYLQLGQPARAQQVLSPLPPQAPFDQHAGRLWLKAQLAPRAEVARPLYAQALALFSDDRDLPFVRLPIEVDRAGVLMPVDGLAACELALAECEGRSLLGTKLHALARLAELLLATGRVHEAAAAARTSLAELAQRQPFHLYLPELWWIAARALAAAGDGAAARAAVEGGADWIERHALPNVPPEFRDSFIHRNRINRMLLTTKTRPAAAAGAISSA